MAEQLKEVYNKAFLIEFSAKVQSVYPTFDADGFVAAVMDDSWGELALKARTRRISEKLGAFLPNRYEAALNILFAIADECVGFPYLFFPDFVAVYGQDVKHWELSMMALEKFTQKSSAEFAIRSFLLRDPERVMRQMIAWAEHANEHVRRLASEGCRPRFRGVRRFPCSRKTRFLYYPSWSCSRKIIHYMFVKVSPIISMTSRKIILILC